MKEAVENLLDTASRALSGLEEDPKALDQARIRFLGRKGELAQLFKELGNVPEQERREVGRLLNEAKSRLEEIFSEAMQRSRDLETARRESIDVTVPGRLPPLGRLHPITQTAMEISRIFNWLGFETVEGPEIELDYYNFEALNIPQGSSGQGHAGHFLHLRRRGAENAYLAAPGPGNGKTKASGQDHCPGRTYRCDSDVTHTPMFHQVEGLMVGKDVSFGDLKGTLTTFVHQMFGPEVGLRFRPSFFPFTEPSAEVDIECVMCRGGGCRVCKGTGWLEILGSGMIDPEVYKHVGYDPEEVTGFAFGMGIERIAMLKFGIDDLRLFFENDLRFLEQF